MYYLNIEDPIIMFQRAVNEKLYVDKSLLIDSVNELIGAYESYICVTRPRRFGKTMCANMLAAYYTKGYENHKLFENLKISKQDSYKLHLNKHNVIYIDFSVLPDPCDNYRQYIDFVKMKLFLDIKEYYNVEKVPSLPINDYLIKTKDTFIFILDEWDSIFHKEFMTEKNKKEYLEFLKGLLKNKPYVELAYMTGVLPIAKYSSDSELNMFIEHNVLNDSLYDDYFGFNEEEVKKLCIQHNKPTYEELKFWYDGYQKKDGSSIFNPRSVSCAFSLGECQNFWTETGPMNEVSSCIEHNVDAVREDIVNMVAGQSIKVKLKGFSPIESQLMTRNEILTAMVIYGFLSYHNGELHIPNHELMEKFEYTLNLESMGEVAEIVNNSKLMLEATIEKKSELVAKYL